MDGKLFVKAISRVTAGALLVAFLIFVPAGTAGYRNGWLLMAILFIPMFIAGMYMIFKRPDLLRKRLNMKEKEMEQREVVAMSAIMFIASFVVAGLNYRFGWITMPEWSVIAATLLMFLAMPLVLGSPVSFLISILYIPIIAKRIKNEEKVLTEGLEGYAEYREHVRYRLIPFIW